MKSNLEIVWKTIPSLKGYYQASNTGLIKSVDRFVNGFSARAGKPVMIHRKEKMLSQNVRGNGYKSVCICVDGAMKTEQVHKLVLMAFRGVRPKGLVACHNDGNPDNNNITNLRWDWPSENYKDIEKHGTRAKGEKVGTSKLTKQEVIEIKKPIPTKILSE